MCATEHYTYDDYKEWEGNWELIYGYPMMTAPSPIKSHQIIASAILVELANSIKECRECLVILEQDWKICDDTIVKPDVVMICNEPLEGNYITKTPQIIVEVISKSTAKRDEKTKFKLYQKERVPYYIIAYPNDLKAKVYKLEEKEYEKIADFTDEVMVFDNLKCREKIDFANVFEKLR